MPPLAVLRDLRLQRRKWKDLKSNLLNIHRTALPYQRMPQTQPTPASVAPLWTNQPGAASMYINSVAVCSDASRIVAGTFFHAYGSIRPTEAAALKPVDASQDGTYGTYCYDAAGKLTWKNEFVGWQGVYWVDISDDGTVAASGGWFTNTPTYAGFVRAFDAATGAMLLDVRTSGRVSQVDLSGNGAWLLAASESLTLYKRQSDGTFKATGSFVPPGTGNSIVTAALSTDGSWAVCGDYLGSIYLFENEGGMLALNKAWPLPSGGYSHCVRITPEGSAFAVGGGSGWFYLLDRNAFIAGGPPLVSYQVANQGSVYGVAVSDDASTVVGISNLKAGSNEGGMVYSVSRSGALQWSYQTDRNPNCASLLLEQNLLAVSDGHPDNTPGNFYLLDARSGALIWKYGTPNMSWPIMLSGDGTSVAAGSDDSNVYFFKT